MRKQIFAAMLPLLLFAACPLSAAAQCVCPVVLQAPADAAEFPDFCQYESLRTRVCTYACSSLCPRSEEQPTCDGTQARLQEHDHDGSHDGNRYGSHNGGSGQHHGGR